MWQLSRVVLRNRRILPGRVLGAITVGHRSHGNHQETPIVTVQNRYFSRRGDDDDDDDKKLGRGKQPPIVGDLDDDAAEVDADKQRQTSISAPDMEFYNQLSAEFYDDDDDEDDEQARLDEEYTRKQEEIQRELDTRTGRPWTDPWKITDEQWMSNTTLEDLPDWSPDYVSRISQERVKLHEDGIPTLSTIAGLSLPPPNAAHPGLGDAKAYAAYRKRYHFKYIAKKARELAEPKIEKIKTLSSWDDKQDAVDELFESVEEELKSQEEILGLHPNFSSWVERALEEHLQNVRRGSEDKTRDGVSADEDENTQPIFMDCLRPTDDKDTVVPSILKPLRPHHKDGEGRMVEEWELAANKKTKRILLRECTREVAKILTENESSRIFVHGRKGVGKTALLSSIVASARQSGYIVLYLPDGDRLRKNGYFVTPNALRDGMFDLQNLSQEACANLFESHADDLEGLEADQETMERYFKDSQLKRITDYAGGAMSLVDLLKYAEERKIHAPMCYSVVVDRLMAQDQKPFLMVMDEFNCYYDRGHYFHMAYDNDVREPIPHEKINLFEHALGAMALSTSGDETEFKEPTVAVKRGGIIVATSESHAVPRGVTEAIVSSAKMQLDNEDAARGVDIVEVPHFSDIEVDHILANFEVTGVGKLRLDRGDTVMDDQEVAYLKMISGRIGQKLLDAAVL